MLAKALQVAKGVLVDEADQAKEFEQRVLQRCSREQQLVPPGQRQLQRVGDDVLRLVDVAQAMGFVDDHQIPWQGVHVARLAFDELVGTDDDLGRFKRAELALFDRRVVGPGFQNAAGEKEFLREFLIPLRAQVGGHDDQNPALSLRPFLRQHEAGFDGLAKADFIGQQRAFGKRRPESE